MRFVRRTPFIAVAAMIAAATAGSAVADSAVATTGTTSVARAGDGFKPFNQPRPAYVDRACLAPLTTVPDGTSVDLLVTQCGFELTVSPTAVKESVPATWQRWGHQPLVEGPKPDVLYTDGSPTLTLSFGFDVQNTVGGVEVEPRAAGPAVFEADYYSGPNGTGTLVGSVVRQASAPGGARLLAARSQTPWQSIVITNRSGGDFAVAKIRGA